MTRLAARGQPGAPEGSSAAAPRFTRVDERIAEQARRRPDACAVTDRRRSLTHGQLDQAATRMARALRLKGVRHGARVATVLDLCCDLAVAWLAIWKAGATLVPLDPAHPVGRLQAVLADADCRLVVCDSSQAEALRPWVRELLFVDAHADWIASLPATALRIAPARPAPAYLIYTSGSTGRPKGVLMAHSALLHKLDTPGTWGPTRGDWCAAWVSAPTFDPSLAQLLLPLAHGGRVVALAVHERMNPASVWAVLRQHRVDLLDCTPSWLQAMLEVPPGSLALARIVLGGESLAPTLAARLARQFPAAKIVNLYGPTETCIDATAHEVCEADLQASSVPIGRPLPGYAVRVLDGALAEVAPGVVGELCIGGAGLAIGYWKNRRATVERFIADPFEAGARLYRTGDLVCQRPDGTLDFIGRADQQIKLRGQRIEPAEVERALTSAPGVRAAAVRVWEGAGSTDDFLAGYLVLADGADLPGVRAHLRQRLPGPMVPATLTALAALPLSGSGKVDRSALPRPGEPAGARTPPRDDLEARLHAIWCDVLGTDAFGVHDNFYEVGGHSLAAVRVVAQVRDRLGFDLPLATLLARPTLAELARAVVRGADRGTRSRCLPLGAGHADRPQLFLLPPGSGVGLVYLGLARELAATATCVALQAIDLPGTPPGRSSMEALVGHFTDDVVRLQPRGPIRLLGYSAGGAIAQAMAHALHAAGREVSHLVLIDPYSAEDSASPSPAASSGIDPERGFLDEACPDLVWDAIGLRGRAAEDAVGATRRLWREGLSQPGWQAGSPAGRQLVQSVAEHLPGTMAPDLWLLLLEGLANIWWAYVGQRMRPLSRFGGQAWIVQPDGDDPATRDDRLRHWRGLVPAARQRLVCGEHPTMLERADTLSAVARVVREALALESAVAVPA